MKLMILSNSTVGIIFHMITDEALSLTAKIFAAITFKFKKVSILKFKVSLLTTLTIRRHWATYYPQSKQSSNQFGPFNSKCVDEES